MGFTIEQECPQCGAPIDLDETDHLLKCPYCDVNNFLFASDYFRFILPHKVSDKEIIYAPYLRFKGNVYFCHGQTVGHRVVDITHLGLPFKGIPPSLGVRPQAMKMKFVTAATEGSFLKFSRKATDILAKAGKISSASSSGKIFHQAHIGESLSLIYLPLFVDGGSLFDAILKRPIAKLPQGKDIFGPAINKAPRWNLTFIPTLCPKCGWNLEGQSDSVVLTCSNCETGWQALKGKFARVNLMVVPGKDVNAVYLPFWKTFARAEDIDINSFGDFLRVTSQPMVVGKELEAQEMSFWSPAFKIRPKIFLRLSKRMTISQRNFQTEDTTPRKNLYPVTLPQTEALQAMKITLAGSALNKKKFMPLLPSVRFNIGDSILVYIPFTDTGHDMVQQDMHISINKNALKFGRRL